MDKTIYDQIRKTRRARGLRQMDVAHAVGLERETYCRIERGQQGTTVATMQAIGKVLGLRLTFEAADVGKMLAKFCQNFETK